MERYQSKFSVSSLEVCMTFCMGQCRGFGYSQTYGQCQLVKDRMYTDVDELDLDGQHDLYIVEAAPTEDETYSRDPILLSELATYVSDPYFSFHVQMSSSQNPGNSGRVPYDVAKINSGGLFNLSAHQFVCPVNGTYLFTSYVHKVAVTSVANNEVGAYLMHNGNLIARGNSERSPSHQTQASTAIIHHCAAGDVVSAHNVYAPIETGLLSAFSGALLNRDSPVMDSTGVYFNVYPAGNINVGDVLAFGNIVHNGGGHYDTSTNNFTCPITGVYLFSVNIEDHSTYPDVAVAIYKEAEHLATASTARSMHSNSNYFESGHAMAVTSCTKNEKIMVKVTYLQGASAILLGWRETTFFTGSLLYGDSSSQQQVSFSAALSIPPTDTRIIFSQVELNDEGHYNSATGNFTCPTKGDYFFCMSMVSSINSGACRARLMKNSDVLAEVLMKEGPTTTVGTATGMVVAHCEPGDIVFVERYLCNDASSFKVGLTKFFGLFLH